jgi:hypothetical protein
MKYRQTLGPTDLEMEEPMTGAQLLNELRMDLEASLEALPRESDERRSRIRDLDDRSLWSGRRRGVA